MAEMDYRKLAVIVECSDDAIVGMTIDGIITSWNRGAEGIFGYSDEETIGDTILKIIPPEGHEQALQIIKRLGRGQGLKQFYIMGLRKNGQKIHLALNISSVKDDGKVFEIAAIARDITEKTEIERALRVAVEKANTATQAKSDFLATMSHEIRTPLNGVLAASDLLLVGDLTPEKQRSYFEMINKSGRILLHLINNILDLSKIESGTLKLENVNFDLNELIEDSVSLWEGEAQKKNLDLFVKVAAGLPRVFNGDCHRIRQVLVNLVSNAVKFTESGHVAIRVSAETQGAKSLLRFEVTDTGVGIDSESQACIFERFEQLHKTAGEHHNGVGLGLSISKKLVELMGGQIGIDNRATNGSIFWFTVLCGQAKSARERRESLEAESTSSTQRSDDPSLRILVAEDDENNQKLLFDILQMEGHTIDVVSTGLEALDAVRKQNYDLVFMDIRMPKMDGLTAAREIRLISDHYKDIPIIAITANAMRGDKEVYLKAGMTDYVSKPFTVKQIVSAVNPCT